MISRRSSTIPQRRSLSLARSGGRFRKASLLPPSSQTYFRRKSLSAAASAVSLSVSSRRRVSNESIEKVSSAAAGRTPTRHKEQRMKLSHSKRTVSTSNVHGGGGGSSNKASSQITNQRRSRRSQSLYTPISESDLQYLKRNTKYDEDEIREWHNGFKEDCPDGRLRKEKIQEMYSLILPNSDTTAFVNQIFRIFDKDGNGSIDFVEFMLATDMTCSGTVQEKLSWVFRLYDKDGSGTINLEEMMDIFETLFTINPEQSTASTSKDSQSYQIKLTLVRERAEKIFNKLDINGDGDLTEEEFITGCMGDIKMAGLLDSISDGSTEASTSEETNRGHENDE